MEFIFMIRNKMEREKEIKYKIGDYFDFEHQGAFYRVCIARIDDEREYKYNMVGIRIGSQITNQKDCSGSFISTKDEWWKITGKPDCNLYKRYKIKL